MLNLWDLTICEMTPHPPPGSPSFLNYATCITFNIERTFINQISIGIVRGMDYCEGVHFSGQQNQRLRKISAQVVTLLTVISNKLETFIYNDWNTVRRHRLTL